MNKYLKYHFKHKIQTLQIVEFLVVHGSLLCVQEIFNGLYKIKTLETFSYFQHGSERATKIREISKRICLLLSDPESLKADRLGLDQNPKSCGGELLENEKENSTTYVKEKPKEQVKYIRVSSYPPRVSPPKHQSRNVQETKEERRRCCENYRIEKQASAPQVANDSGKNQRIRFLPQPEVSEFDLYSDNLIHPSRETKKGAWALPEEQKEGKVISLLPPSPEGSGLCPLPIPSPPVPLSGVEHYLDMLKDINFQERIPDSNPESTSRTDYYTAPSKRQASSQ
eukprot:TRINITY_DN753_c0_g1_i6.p1 TRINITY_DN753_c0_g1~~TRINITY_DN753_c0_g1_i6.p1  ORF type:complete len:283 (-),score=30.34 TRINITY_DN753_c0_g1_i6:15-863(-)